MKLYLQLFALISVFLNLSTFGLAVKDPFKEDLAAAKEEENRKLSDVYSQDVKDKCGEKCSSHKDCDDSCSNCFRKKDEWGEPKKYGICIDRPIKKESKKKSAKEDCYCSKHKKYCHVCSSTKWGKKKCSYKWQGECKKDKKQKWSW